MALVACKFLISIYFNYLYLMYSNTLRFVRAISSCDAGSSLSFVLDFSLQWTVLHGTVYVLTKCHELTYLLWMENLRKPRSMWRNIQSSLNVVAQASQFGGTLRKPGFYSPYIVDSSFGGIFFVKHFCF